MEYFKTLLSSIRKNIIIIILILFFTGVCALLLFNISSQNETKNQHEAELKVKQQQLEELRIQFEEYKSQDDGTNKYKENKAFEQGYSYPNEIRIIDKNK
jgi:hypothetical protein